MRLKLATAFGIPIYVHVTFLLLPLLLWLFPSDVLEPLLAHVLLLATFGCVVLHELGHALTARQFGIPTRDITLYPIGGVARLERMTERPLEEFLIAVAGPAVNVVIAIVLALVLIPLAVADQAVLETFGGQFLLFLLMSNVLLVVFNMLPAFPMDGGRVFRALLATVLSHVQATQIAATVGMVVAALMGLAGALYLHAPMLVLVAGFVIFAGQQELLASRHRERQRRWDEEEPLEVLPVRRVQPAPSAPVLFLQPKISVYTWDNQTGAWRKDANLPQS